MVWAPPQQLMKLSITHCRVQLGEVRTSGRMTSADRKMNALTLAAALLLALALGGCSSSIADLPSVGTPAGAPVRPTDAGGYLPVHDLPPDRGDPELEPAERAKIQAELIAARDRQAAAAQDPAAKDPAAK
jgi:hypothetical protein